MNSTIVSIILTQMAQPTAEPTGDVFQWALSLIKWVAEQFAAHNYVGATAAIVMAAVFIIKLLFKDKLSSEKLPLVSAGMGLLASLAASLVGVAQGAPFSSIMSIVMTGLTTGAMASGFWSLAGKHFVDWIKRLLAKKNSSPPAEPPAEQK